MHFLADAAPTIHTEIRITPYFVGFIHRAHGISKPFDVKSVMVNWQAVFVGLTLDRRRKIWNVRYAFFIILK